MTAADDEYNDANESATSGKIDNESNNLVSVTFSVNAEPLLAHEIAASSITHQTSSVHFNMASNSSRRYPHSDQGSPLKSLRRKLSRNSLRQKQRTPTGETLDGSSGPNNDSSLKEDPLAHLWRQESVVIKVRPGDYFTEFADVKAEVDNSFNSQLGTLGELRHLLRTGTKPQIKKFIRSNLWPSSHRIRGELWKELCSDINLDSQRLLYSETLQRLQDSNFNFEKPRLLNLPGIVVCEHRLNPAGHAALTHIVTVVEQLRPEFTYIPTLQPLAGLFLHYMNEGDVFACIMRLLTLKTMMFLTQTDLMATASKRTLLVLIKRHASKAYSLLKKTLVPPGSTADVEEKILVDVLEEWKAWLYRDLPFSHVVKVVDCFLFEGPKVLYRVALALLMLWQTQAGEIVRGTEKVDPITVKLDISSFCQVPPVGPGKLLKIGFTIRNLKSSSIERLQERNELKSRRKDTSLNLVASKIQMQRTLSTYFEQSFKSNIVTRDDRQKLMHWLPPRMQLNWPVKLFSLAEHGSSFVTFWNKIERFDQTVIVVQTVDKQVFGAYCSQSWSIRNQLDRYGYFGNGESFIFILGANGSSKFAWVGMDNNGHVKRSQEMFLAAGPTSFTIGGGSGEALSFNETLERGRTDRCDTFENPPLCEVDDHDGFNVCELEVYTLVPHEHVKPLEEELIAEMAYRE